VQQVEIALWGPFKASFVQTQCSVYTLGHIPAAIDTRTDIYSLGVDPV
jgi:hypothetical protein